MRRVRRLWRVLRSGGGLSVFARLVILAMLATTSALVIIAWGALADYASEEENERAVVKRLVLRVGDAYEARLAAVDMLFAVLARRAASDAKDCAVTQDAYAGMQGTVVEAGIVDTRGRLLCDTASPNAGHWHVASQPVVRHVLKASMALNRGFLVNEKSGEALFVEARPVKRHQTVPGAILFVAVRFGADAQPTRQTWKGSRSIALLDAEGRVLDARSAQGVRIGRRWLPAGAWRAVRAGDPDQQTGIVSAAGRFYAYLPIAHGLAYAVVEGGPTSLYAAPHHALWRNLAIVAVFLSMTLVLAWRWLVMPLVRRAETLRSVAVAIEQGDLHARTGMRPDRDELAQVGHAFDRMAEALAARTREAEQHLQQLDHVNRLYRVLNAVSRALLQGQDERSVLEAACRRPVEQGEFCLAWVGMVDRARQRVNAVAVYASEQPLAAAFCDLSLPLEPNAAEAQGIVAAAARSGRMQLSNALLHDARLHPWQQLLARARLKAGAALPLSVGGQVRYVWALYSRDRDFFTPEDVSLLERLAGDMSHVLRALAAERRARHLATHDPLTGLANRQLVLKRLEGLLMGARLRGGRVAVIKVTVANLQPITDATGQRTGDELLRSIAEVLQEQKAENDLLGRTSAGFAYVMSDADSVVAVGNQAGALVSALAREFLVAGELVYPRFRAGVALFPDDADTAETLLDYAREAANMPVSEPVAFFAPRVDAELRERRRLEGALREALKAGALELHYQPVVEAETGRVAGFEALARWLQGPGGEAVPPARFIPVAESAGLIGDLGEWALRTAARQAREWAQAGHVGLRIAVNVSAAQFHQPDFAESVISALEIEPGPGLGNSIALEITESLLIRDQAGAKRMLERLAARGVPLYLDDFGTGYSALTYLHTLPFDVLKIDQCFTREFEQSKYSRAVVQFIVSFAASLNLRVIAEGVETQAQFDNMRAIGCDYVQGYFTGRPVPAAQATAALASSGHSISGLTPR